MKSSKYINLFLVFFICGILQNSILAQEHGYQWGKWYKGQGDQGYSYDKLIGSYVDSLGNTYIFGQFGKDARLGGPDAPYICPMDTISDYSYAVENSRGLFLAKIDSAGNVLWHKWVRNGSKNSGCNPWNMVVKDNLITIAFDNVFGNEWYNWFYFFDTMLVEPMDLLIGSRKSDIVTYFVTFDFDGNIMDDHDIRLYALSGSGTYSSSNLLPCMLCFGGDGKFIIDEDNNIHIFSCTSYANEDSLHKAYIIVDNDTNRKYPQNVHKMNGRYFSNSAYYIMDSNWNLIGSRYMIDSIVGWDPNTYGGIVELRFSNIIVDGDDIYVNGYFHCEDSYFIALEMSNTDTFAVKVFLDSTHYLRIDNTRDFDIMPFLLKLDKSGTILWTQQIYTKSPNDQSANFGGVGGIAFDKEYVYSNCRASYFSDFYSEPNYFFLDSAYSIPIIRQATNFNLTTAYNKATGIPVTFYFVDTLINKSRESGLKTVENILVLNVAFQTLKKTELCKINKYTKEVSKEDPIHYSTISIAGKHLAIDTNGWVFRGELGSGARVYDSILLGNPGAVVMTFFYDSTFDFRRRPCPQVDSLWGSISGLVATLSWNGQSGIADYELSYIPEGGNWDNAFTFETSDTNATLTLLYDRCYQFRIRGHCTRKGKPYSAWSEPFTICPEAGIEGIGGTGAISLYPNPATGRVQVLGLGEELKQIEVIDMKGNVVSTFSNTTTFDITDLPQGSYLVKLHTAAGTTLHQKLVKSNSNY